MGSIIQLEKTVNKLRTENKNLFDLVNRIFYLSSSEGKLDIPSSFGPKVREYFGHRGEDGQIMENEQQVVKRLKTQQVVKTFNRWTGEGALFNWLRASRPGMRPADIAKEKQRVYEHIKQTMKNCDFCEPTQFTSQDVFGRVRGKHCITGANIAKYDAWSGMVYFSRHNPLAFSQEELSDYLDTGFRWFQQVHECDKEFRYPFFVWNCLEKAGASQVHGHAQVLMGKAIHYAKVETVRLVVQRYRKETGREYFDDLYSVHDALGLAFTDGGVRILAYVSPIKEKEIVLVTSTGPSENMHLRRTIFNTLRCYIDKFGVTSFNLAIAGPRVDGGENFPYLVRIVDRGSIFKSTADMGGMELYGSSVIATDPYRVIEAVRDFYGDGE